MPFSGTLLKTLAAVNQLGTRAYFVAHLKDQLAAASISGGITPPPRLIGRRRSRRSAEVIILVKVLV
jgi:hypothetical protein